MIHPSEGARVPWQPIDSARVARVIIADSFRFSFIGPASGGDEALHEALIALQGGQGDMLASAMMNMYLGQAPDPRFLTGPRISVNQAGVKQSMINLLHEYLTTPEDQQLAFREDLLRDTEPPLQNP